MSDSEVESIVSDAPEEEEVVENLTNPDVVTKYRKAGEIANAALQLVVEKCVAGAAVVDICNEGDAYITAETKKLYKKGKIEKGIAFPTCVSINHVVGHYSPLTAESTATVNSGDLVKVDLGVHIDGYIAVGAHSFIVGDDEIKGKKADVLMATYKAAECAIRLMKAGNTNTQVTEMIADVAEAYGVNPVQGVLSHEMERFLIDGDRVILNRVDPEQKVEEVKFEENQVYAIDIVMSTGEGKPNEVDERVTVYKRNNDVTYKLKMKASRAILSAIDQEFPTFPFTIRALEEKKVRFGIVECNNHSLVHGYPVLEESEGDFVAHIKFTVLIMPNNSVRITGLPCDSAAWLSEKTLEKPELIALLATSAGKKKRKKKKKKKKAAVAGAP